jgi:DNA mismatch repair protein MutS
LAKQEVTKVKGMKKTPLMEQYFKLKAKYPGAILLFRVGDFYETFGEDAVKAANALGIVLTKRNNGGVDIELAGFPYHSLDLYLPRLVKAGFRIAICEQLEKPSKEKKIVKRGVTEVVTPGVTTNDNLLDYQHNNYLSAIFFGPKDIHGVAFLDLSTGEFLVSQGSLGNVEKLIQGFNPSEILFSKSRKNKYDQIFGDKYYTYHLDEWIFTPDYGKEKLLNQFEVQTLKGFGVEELEYAQIAAGACLHYLETTENDNLKHVNSIQRIKPEKYVWLDRFTIRNLELIHSNHATGVPLIEILDNTVTPMGSRMMKKWLLLPLITVSEINARLDMVKHFFENNEAADEVVKSLRQIGDLERIISKVPLGKVSPREIRQLRRALTAIVPIKQMFSDSPISHLAGISEKLNPCIKLCDLIEKTISEEPPALISKGNVIKDGCHEELDELRGIVRNSKELLLEIQQEEAKQTGITNLKIGFNNVFGYYLEVTNKYKNQGLVPDNWIRKQTLTGSERYVTDELKKLEDKILGAEDKILVLEESIYIKLVTELIQYIEPIQYNAKLIAQLDCLISMAVIAQKNNYCRPSVTDGLRLDIKGGRHPVIEQHLEIGESYVPNDVYLNNDDHQILMITGPNMSGKSAILRQTALICLMAQMGSFVPATSAEIGYIDKLFTRVGASDNISSGESTFMVEMNETASIMNNISQRSLILLDEIGRGTSTFDGISIAWSLAEYLHSNTNSNPKTLFATHYHELNELANKFDRIKNYNVATKEVGNRVIFLRKLKPGGSKHSFGIYVAKMAGMPKEILERATRIMKTLEQKSIDPASGEQSSSIEKSLQELQQEASLQLSIFETVDPTAGKIKQEIIELDLNSMTPIECMLKLNELRKIIDEKEIL